MVGAAALPSRGNIAGTVTGLTLNETADLSGGPDVAVAGRAGHRLAGATATDGSRGVVHKVGGTFVALGAGFDRES
jgi:hypothetical protein